MKARTLSRRDFIKSTMSATATIGLGSKIVQPASVTKYDSKGLPTRVLGTTGVVVPILAIGTGSRFCSVNDEEKALEILTHALDNGLYFWDTAHTYRKGNAISEERLGKILRFQRSKVFVSTKVKSRDPDEAKKQIETSFKRLQTDHIDLLQIHLIESLDDVDAIGKKGGVYEIVKKLKEEKVVSYIGFTGHISAKAMKTAAGRYEFDTMLIALNHYQKGQEKFEEHAVPFAATRGMGVNVMKVIRPRETARHLRAQDLIRYALSLEHVTAAIVGTDSLKVLQENIALLKNFRPLKEHELERIRTAMAPFYYNRKLEWMSPTYTDGYA